MSQNYRHRPRWWGNWDAVARRYLDARQLYRLADPGPTRRYFKRYMGSLWRRLQEMGGAEEYAVDENGEEYVGAE